MHTHYARRALAARRWACFLCFRRRGAAPGRIRGEIENVDGGMLAIKTRDGAVLKVKLADDARVGSLVKASLADIKNDAFIGIAGMPQADGSIRAFSVHTSCRLSAARCRTDTGPGTRAGQHHDQRLCREHGEEQGRRDLHGEVQGRREEDRGDAGTVIAAVAGDRTSSRRASTLSSSPRRSSRTARCWPR